MNSSPSYMISSVSTCVAPATMPAMARPTIAVAPVATLRLRSWLAGSSMSTSSTANPAPARMNSGMSSEKSTLIG
jgi:hypothetical protein